jgi:hypothetical protein
MASSVCIACTSLCVKEADTRHVGSRIGNFMVGLEVGNHHCSFGDHIKHPHTRGGGIAMKVDAFGIAGSKTLMVTLWCSLGNVLVTRQPKGTATVRKVPAKAGERRS